MIWLIFAHFIGDWGLQNRWMAENKAKYCEVLLAHSFIYTACICIALQYLSLYGLCKALFVLVGHYVIDYWKSKSYKTDKDRWMLWVDQLAHFIQLGIVFWM